MCTFSCLFSFYCEKIKLLKGSAKLVVTYFDIMLQNPPLFVIDLGHTNLKRGDEKQI